MKYKVEVIINIPRDKMLELFQDMKFMKKWQEGFESLTHLEGTPGEVGAISLLNKILKARHQK